MSLQTIPGTTLRKLLKEITPPFLLRIKRWLLPAGAAPKETLQQLSLRLRHEQLNAGAPENLLHLRPGVSMWMHPDSIWAAQHFCYQSPAMVAEMDCFLALTKRKQNLLDIGALHGVFSLAFAATHPESRVVAVDASPFAFATLLYNIHTNRFSNITPVECAVSDSQGTLRMHYEWQHAVSAGTQCDSSNSLVVEKRTADDLCESQHFLPDVIKLDVEGHEAKVLRGLAKTLSQCRPIVFLEIHPQRLIQENDSPADVASCLFDLNYTAQTNGGRSMSQSDIERLQQDERVVFFKRPKATKTRDKNRPRNSVISKPNARLYRP
jgi:FkbM family methyltransferase